MSTTRLPQDKKDTERYEDCKNNFMQNIIKLEKQ